MLVPTDSAAKPRPAALEVKAHPLAVGVVRAVLALFSWVPARVRSFLAVGVGRFAFAVGIRRAVTLDNLRHAFPERSEAERRQIARGAYGNMARVIHEALFALELSPAQRERAIQFDNYEVLERALAGGKGVLIATAHFGNWELMGEVMAQRGLRLNAVVRPLRGALNAELMRRRVESGLGLIAPRGAILETVRRLAKNEVVSLLVDQSLPSKSALFVPFFGRLAATAPALSMAALRSGAPVLVAMGVRTAEGIRVHFEGPFPVSRTGDRDGDLLLHTATITAVIERVIRAHPDQWLWLHRRWKRVPPPPKPAAAARVP